jgi:heptosyltransferase-1
MTQKNYPKEKFLQISDILETKIAVVWGTEEELEIGEWLVANSDNISLAPKMNLDQLKHYISTSSLVIGNDTGPTHMAWALNVPSIVIFGLTPVEQAFQTPLNRVIKSNSPVNHRKIDKSDFSIRNIDAMRIVELAQELLDCEVSRP